MQQWLTVTSLLTLVQLTITAALDPDVIVPESEKNADLSGLEALMVQTPEPTPSPTGACASCDLVPCGYCQQGCSASTCGPPGVVFEVDHPGSTSRNACEERFGIQNYMFYPPACRAASTSVLIDTENADLRGLEALMVQVQSDPTFDIKQCAMKWRPEVYLDIEETHKPQTVQDYLPTCALYHDGPCGNKQMINKLWKLNGAGLDYYDEELLQLPNVQNIINMTDNITMCSAVAATFLYEAVQCTAEDYLAAQEKLTAYGALTIDNLQSMVDTQGDKCNADEHGTGKGGCYLRCLGCGDTDEETCDLAGASIDAERVVPADELKDYPYYINIANDNTSSAHGWLIQYNFFYAMNGAPSPLLGGLGAHQADWEKVVVKVNNNCSTKLGVQYAAHGDLSSWDTSEGNKFFSAQNSHATFKTLQECKDAGEQCSEGDKWFPDTVVVVKEEMPEVFEFTGRWGTTHAHDGIWADWFTTNAIPDVLDWYGKNKIKQPNKFAKRAKLEAVKVFANKVLTSLDDAFATSDLCPQGPTGPMY